MKINCTCSICLDSIENDNTNITITECSHKFHSTCLINMITYGSFKCPECRFILGTSKDETITEYNDSHFETDYDDEFSSYISDEETELYTDYALRGLRFFTNNLLGNSHTTTDLEEEKKYFVFDNDDDIVEDNEPYSDYNLRGLRFFTNNLMNIKQNSEDLQEEFEDMMPSPNKIREHLLKQNMTYDDLVNCILYRCFNKYVEIKEPLKSGKKVIKNINVLI